MVFIGLYVVVRLLTKLLLFLLILENRLDSQILPPEPFTYIVFNLPIRNTMLNKVARVRFGSRVICK